jgi:hypothetical protein
MCLAWQRSERLSYYCRDARSMQWEFRKTTGSWILTILSRALNSSFSMVVMRTTLRQKREEKKRIAGRRDLYTGNTQPPGQGHWPVACRRKQSGRGAGGSAPTSMRIGPIM